jgi:hypothetical protein
MLIREIRNELASKICVLPRSSYRIKSEKLMMKLAFSLRPFTALNQITCLEQYWNKTFESPNQELLRNFAEVLVSMSSETFSDNNWQFTGIPLQIMMLGETFVKEAGNYCLSGEVNLQGNFNLLALFRKFTETKCDIYLKEKYRINCSTPLAKMGINVYIKEHMNLALMSLSPETNSSSS